MKKALPEASRRSYARFYWLLPLALVLCLPHAWALKNADTAGVNVRSEKITIAALFKTIEKQIGYIVFYNNNLLNDKEQVKVDFVNADINVVMEYVLKGKNLQYTIRNHFILLQKKESKEMLAPEASQRKDSVPDAVKGRITSAPGNEPLIGVTVKNLRTGKGVVSDAKGHFEIAGRGGDALQFTYVGMQQHQVTIGDPQTPLTVSLSAAETFLNKVVVTALGIKRKEKSLGYAVSEVNGSEFTQARETNVAWALSGQIAGVNVVKPVTGAMGSSRVLLRGNGSFGNNQPLYVVDGLPISNNSFGAVDDIYGGMDGGDGISSINPDDIETMTVLKGATAAALYGSRASNGAIIITTKGGRARKGVGVEFNSSFTLDKPNIKSNKDYQWEYGQGYLGKAPQDQQEAFLMGALGWGQKLDGSQVIQFDGEKRPYSAFKDNFKNFYGNGQTFTNNIAFSGGNETTTYRFSFTDMNNKDVVPNSGIRRDNLTLNAATKPIKNLTLTTNVMYVRERVKNRARVNDSDGNGQYLMYVLPANFDVRNLDRQTDEQGQEYLFSSNIYLANPYFVAYHYVNNDAKDRWMGNVKANYDFTKNFYATLLVGTDNSYRHSTSVRPYGSAVAKKGSIGEGDLKNGEFNLQLITGYNKEISKNWSLNVMAGGNVMKSFSKSSSGNGSEFIVPGFNSVNNTKITSFSYYENNKQINSLFANAEAVFRNYIYLNVAGRNDWFSTLNPGSNNIFYPSVGLSVVLSDAVQLPSWISYAKARGSWAQSGGDTDPYALMLTYGFGNTLFGQPTGNVATSTVPNYNLKPLTQTSYEAGIEARFFQDRIGVDLTYYNRKTVDDILLSTISTASGYNNVRLNVGSIHNRGVELSLTGTPVKSAAVRWDATFNMAYNKNMIVSLVGDQKSLTYTQSRGGYWGDEGTPTFLEHRVGEPYGMLTGYTYVRDAAGNIVFGTNGLPKKGPIEKLGNGVSPLTLGFRNAITYKGFNLNILLDGKFGGKIYSGTNNLATFRGLTKITLEGREGGLIGKGVTEDGKPNTVKVSSQEYFMYLANNITEAFMYDASFLKLRQIVLGYSLPASMLKRTPFQGISLSFVARNLFNLIDHVPLVDPESTFSTGNAQGIEQMSLPATRSYGLNLNIKL